MMLNNNIEQFDPSLANNYKLPSMNRVTAEIDLRALCVCLVQRGQI